MEYFLKAPQIGEVGHSVTIVKYHKVIGERVAKDEPIMTLETNKAALEVESTVAGTVIRYIFSEGDTVPVGNDIAILLLDDEPVVTQMVSRSEDDDCTPADNTHDTSTSTIITHTFTAINDLKKDYMPVEETEVLKSWIEQTRNSTVSPRQKAYCLQNKVVPISAHKEYTHYASNTHHQNKHASNDFYVDVPSENAQIRLAQNLMESTKHIVQANVQILCDNTPIEEFKRTQRRLKDSTFVASRLEIITWSAITAMRTHAQLRSRLINQTTLRQFKNPNIGIAVALENDALTTAVIQGVFSHNFLSFCQQCRKSIDEAKRDEHLPTYHSLVISDLSSYGVINAVPIVVAPSTATLFIGKPYIKEHKSHYFNLSLSFDHRIINGAGAAKFLQDVGKSLSRINQQNIA